MASGIKSAEWVQFDSFEVSLLTAEVRRKGRKLRLSGQPAQVLLLLVMREGQLVTREELRASLWPSETNVDFDHGLNNCINRIREVLGDSAARPRYVETLPKLGYRFVASISSTDVPPPTAKAALPPVIPANQPTPVEPQVTNDAHSAPSTAKKQVSRRFLPTVLFASAAVAAILIGATIWYAVRPLPLPSITEYNQITHDGHIGGIAGTDGTRIYFSRDPGEHVEQIGVGGGDIVKVPTGATHVAALDVSADGANLLTWSLDPNRLWIVGTLGGSPRMIADASGQCNHSWSPDAKYIAYNDCPGERLLVMRTDGTGVRQLATIKGEITDIAWFPDGSRIRFTADDALWEISSTGGNLHRVLPDWNGPTGQCCGRWTPDGDFYLFLAAGNLDVGPRVGGFKQIWVLDERRSLFHRISSGPLQLTSGPLHWGTPFPTRDGEKIIVRGTIARGELVRFDPRSKVLLPFLGGISAEFLAYSRDGTQVSYVTYPEGILWRAKADGSERVQLTSPPMRPFVGRWSPDGSQILFSAPRDPTRYGLYLVPAQGGNPVPVATTENDGEGVDGNWSPDGRKIVYHVFGGGARLLIYDLVRHESTRIPGGEGLYSARWSPDGRYIVAMTTSNGAIKILDVQTGQWSSLAAHPGGNWNFPAWSHDSRYVYALNLQEPWSVYRIPVSHGAPERIVDLSNTHLTGSVDFWFGIDPSDTPLLLRDNGFSDIYALTLNRE